VAQPNQGDILTLGGRTFRLMSATNIECDCYLHRIGRQIGLDKLKPEPGEAGEQFALRLHALVIESGLATALLAGAIVPAEIEDVQWSPRVAKETTEYLRTLGGEAEKAVLHDALIQFSVTVAHMLLSAQGVEEVLTAARVALAGKQVEEAVSNGTTKPS
jgi:hypothetical protein